jgi:hypothetical protein
MTETFLGADLLGHVTTNLPGWRLAVTREGAVLMATGSGALTTAEARRLARALHRTARMAERERERTR